MLEKRREYVMSEMQEIETQKQNLFAHETEMRNNLADAKARSSQLLQDAKHQSETIISESKIEAKNNYDLSLQEAQAEIARLKLKMQEEMHHENVDLILSATEELTMKNISSADNRKFVEDFLSKIDKEL